MSDWNQFTFRNLWQHPLWENFQQSIGRKTWRFEKNGSVALVIKHPLPLGLCWFEVPRGPLFENEADFQAILENIRKTAEKERTVFIRMSSYIDLPLDAPDTAYDHHPETSLILDLTLSEEEILSQMKSKGRYNIKLAEKHGVKVEVSQDIEAFHHLLKKTGERDEFGIHGVEYYRKMVEALGSHAELLMAHYEDRLIAGGIFVYLEEWGIYYYGASDHHYRNLMAPYLVQWEAIKGAKNRGCKQYDFLGIAPDGVEEHPWAGVTEFKKKFGGKMVKYPRAKDLILKPFWYYLYKWRKG